MEVPSYLRIAREHAAAQMRSTCTITRPGDGERVWNEATGTYTDPPRVTVYAGHCKVRTGSRAIGTAEGGELEVAVEAVGLDLPVEGSEDVRRNDVAKIDTNPFDEALVGREFVVQAPPAATMQTARRLPVEAVH